jgi:hypothetical protein
VQTAESKFINAVNELQPTWKLQRELASLRAENEKLRQDYEAQIESFNELALVCRKHTEELLKTRQEQDAFGAPKEEGL